MLGILDTYYDITRNNELGGLLGGLSLFGPNPLGERPLDPASWDDWTKAVRKITSNDSLDDLQTLQATVSLLKEYNDNQGFDLKEVINFVQKQIDKIIEVRKTWKPNLR